MSFFNPAVRLISLKHVAISTTAARTAV